MKLAEGEAKEAGKEISAEKENGKEADKENKKDESQTPAKKPTINGVMNIGTSSNAAAADPGGDMIMGTPTPKGKGKSGNEGGMISPESLEAT